MTYDVGYFRRLEEELAAQEIAGRCTNGMPSLDHCANTQVDSVFKSVHAGVVNALVSSYMEQRCKGYSPSDFQMFFEGEPAFPGIVPVDIDYLRIPLICEDLHVAYLNSRLAYDGKRIKRYKSKTNMLEAGAVYTPERVAHDIVRRTISNVRIGDARCMKILDFASGTGRFYRQIVSCMNEVCGISQEDAVINNVYAVDIDSVALNICRVNALGMLDNLDADKSAIVASHIILKNALVKEELFANKEDISRKDLDGLFFNGFHAVVSNPPYLVLKPNRRKMSAETIGKIDGMAAYFRKSSGYKYSIEGMLNLYQLSIEAMLGMLREGGEMGVICPSTLFADVSATTLRKHLLSKNVVSYIRYFSESDSLFDNVTQATCIFHLTKGGCSKTIDVVNNGKDYKISTDDVRLLFKSNWEIPPIDEIEWAILKKLLPVKPLKEQGFIRNKRGELDLTKYKDFITKEPTGLRLVRGNMIGGNALRDVNHEYVMPEFLCGKSEDYLSHDYGRKRLVCQQISNQAQRVRLKFVECESSDIIANSCNYITVDEMFMPKLAAILNSALLNWRFKLTSTNNHVNNYELDELPLIDIADIGDDVLASEGADRDRKICRLYGLDEKETEYIISRYYDIA